MVHAALSWLPRPTGSSPSWRRRRRRAWPRSTGRSSRATMATIGSAATSAIDWAWLRGGFQNPGWLCAFRHLAGQASVCGAFGAGRGAWGEAGMEPKAVAWVAEIIDRIEERPLGTGRSPVPTVKVIEALRFLVGEGMPWREPRATAGRAGGSSWRRRLDGWSAVALLRRVHAGLVRMAGRRYADAGHDRTNNLALCRRDGIQPLSADRPSTRLGTGQGPQRRRARLRLVAGQQAVGPAPGPAGSHEPGPPHRCLHLHPR